MNEKSKSSKVIRIIGWGVIAVALVVSLGDILGFIDNQSDIVQKIHSIVFILLLSFVFYLVLKHDNQNRKPALPNFVLSKQANQVRHGIDEDVEIFENSSEAYESMAQLIEESKTEVLHVALTRQMPRAMSTKDPSSYQRYEDSFDHAVEKGIYYTYIYIPENPRKLRADRLHGLKKSNFKAYSLMIPNLELEHLPPLCNFIIINKEALVFNFPNLLGNNIWVLTRHPRIIEQFREYFYTLLEYAKVHK